MPKRKIEREDILKAAAEVVKKSGTEGLNARAVARELGCSTQPVYSQFGSMTALKDALGAFAWEQYKAWIGAYRAQSGRNGYEAYGMGYVRFAREEKGLFRFLYMSRRASAPFIVEDANLADILGEMKNLYGMDEARARKFHADMSVFSYGLAVIQNTGYADLTDEEIETRLRAQFYALYRYYFPEREPLGAREG